MTIYEEAAEQAKRQVALQAFDQTHYDNQTAAKMPGLSSELLARSMLKNSAANAG